MTIPPLIVDNPLAAENLPTKPLDTALPATGRVVGSLNWTNASQIALSVAMVQAAAIFALVATPLAEFPLVRDLVSRPALPILAFLVAAFLRPAVRTPNYSWLLTALSGLAGIAAASLSLVSGQAYLLPIYVASTVVSWMTEMGNHFHVLSQESVIFDGEQRRRNDERFAMLMGQAFVGLLLALILVPLVGLLPAAWLVTLVTIMVGYQGLSERNKKPWIAFRRYLVGYLFYPWPTSVPPGQIISPAGDFISRVASWAIPAGTLIVVGIAEGLRGQLWLAIAWGLLPAAMALAAAMLVAANVAEVTLIRDRSAAWHAIVRTMRQSVNQQESNGLLMGYVAADNSPVIVDRGLCFQHMHVLGATGTNKTSLGLAPMIEQLISFGDSSVIIIDLKGDTPEMYYAADAAVKAFRPQTTMQFFSLENGTRTQIFNPFLTMGWTNLGILERADILCTCCGLTYGFEYGPSFFTSCNAAVMREANLANPDAMSFRQLDREIRSMLEGESVELLPELRKAGIHAAETIGRLACYESLNATPETAANDAALENRLELVKYFQQPQVGYFRLPSTTSSIGAPSIARLILYFLIVAGRMTARKTKVHVIIDEFQRVGSESLEQILQLARSHDIGLVLANQSLSDLQVSSPKVYQAVFGNCAVRQWFSVNSEKDIDILGKLMGTREEIQETLTVGTERSSRSYRTEHVPRARVTDLHTISENPFLSVLQVGGSGRGYARYNGIPFVCYNDYHISAAEFERRRKMPWPYEMPGMIDAREVHTSRSVRKPKREKQPPHKPRIDNEDLFGTDFGA